MRIPVRFRSKKSKLAFTSACWLRVLSDLLQFFSTLWYHKYPASADCYIRPTNIHAGPMHVDQREKAARETIFLTCQVM